ncbi:serine hydrolase domain-containing protein [Streptococcus ferus]|uniref:serine hydrolase domain-containing protein n=1 Tax=Streptococcus ferus TaxID=1345 RepID=UPI00351249AD
MTEHVTSIHNKIKEQIDQNIYLGASLALFDGSQWQEHYYGQVQPDQPVREGLIYDLASVSKVVGVGTVLIFLIEEGRIALDQPLKHYYPDFDDDTVTIRQLLTHASGIDPFIPNRDRLSAAQLTEAINQIKVTADRSFKYTDINFILLGFMLETFLGQSLDLIFQERVFGPFQMSSTSFGPVADAVVTAKDVPSGRVHDPKAAVLGIHTGSAGLFSNLADLESFVNHYLTDSFAKKLSRNYSRSNKGRSLAWDLDGEWLLHTGYTGTFILINIPRQKAAIFLSNRTYEKDDRAQWIVDRDELIKVIKDRLLEEKV